MYENHIAAIGSPSNIDRQASVVGTVLMGRFRGYATSPECTRAKPRLAAHAKGANAVPFCHCSRGAVTAEATAERNRTFRPHRPRAAERHLHLRRVMCEKRLLTQPQPRFHEFRAPSPEQSAIGRTPAVSRTHKTFRRTKIRQGLRATHKIKDANAQKCPKLIP